MNKEAILIATHFIDQNIIRKIKKILKDIHNNRDLYILTGNTGLSLHAPKIKKIIFDNEDTKAFRERGILDNDMDLCRLNIIKILQKNMVPVYDYYWFIEYDVDFNGNWEELLNIKNNSDLICTHIIDYTENDKWIWWKDFKTPLKNIKKIRAFLPIYRISRNMLEEVEGVLSKEGWGGHMEALIPAIINAKGGKINEIGGNSKYTLPQNINKFYNSYPIGFEIWFGEFRWIPHIITVCKRKRRLYHPIKKYPKNIYSMKYFFRKIDKLVQLALFFERKSNIWVLRKSNRLQIFYKKMKEIVSENNSQNK